MIKPRGGAAPARGPGRRPARRSHRRSGATSRRRRRRDAAFRGASAPRRSWTASSNFTNATVRPVSTSTTQTQQRRSVRGRSATSMPLKTALSRACDSQGDRGKVAGMDAAQRRGPAAGRSVQRFAFVRPDHRGRGGGGVALLLHHGLPRLMIDGRSRVGTGVGEVPELLPIHNDDKAVYALFGESASCVAKNCSESHRPLQDPSSNSLKR